MRALLLAAVLAAGCGSKGGVVQPDRVSLGSAKFDEERAVATEAFPPRPPFVRTGERMTYRLSMHELDVASMTLVVGERAELAGRDVVVVQSGVQSSPLVSLVKPVEDNFTSWIDVATSRPVLYRAEELASASDATLERSDSEVSTLADGKYTVRLLRADVGELVEQQVVGEAPLFDLNGFLVTLRTWDVEPGTTASADVIRSRFIWRTQVTMMGYDSVVTELGEIAALRMDGASRRVGRDGEIEANSETRRYSLWVSDDADRVPVLMVGHTDYGELRMEIVAYEPGAGTRIGE